MTDASRRTVLLGARIRLVCSLLAPCAAGASVISVRHRIYEQDHQGDEISNNNNPINNFIDKLIFHVLAIISGLSIKIGTVDPKF